MQITKTIRAAGMATDLIDFIGALFIGYSSTSEAESFKESQGPRDGKAFTRLSLSPSVRKLAPVMHRLPRINYHDIERVIEFDFVRATEAAALHSLRWL